MAAPEYQVIARRFRPQSFVDVIGQEAVTQTLANAITKGRVAQAYLFAGPRGVGKTSIARILSKSLNCVQGPTVTPCGVCDNCRAVTTGNDTDVLEIDGASNRSIDDVRELRERVRFAPAHSRYKIYIIDEVHMLTTEAFNALLKTLEEPPPNVLFVFATTRLDKVPATIVSRCQRFIFRRIAPGDVEAKLRRIASQEGFDAEDRALALIARRSAGSMRDAESLFDQVIAFSGDRVTARDVERTLGLVAGESVENLVKAVLAGDGGEALRATHELAKEGADLTQAAQQAVEFLRDLTVISAAPDSPGLLEMPADDVERLREIAAPLSTGTLINVLNVFLEATAPMMARAFSPRIVLEYAALKAARVRNLLPVETLLAACRDVELPATAPKQAPATPGRTRAETHPDAPAPAPTPPLEEKQPGGEGAQSLTETWQLLLKGLSRNERALHALVSAGRLISLEGGVLRVGFPAAYAMSAAKVNEPARRAALEQAAGAIIGEKVAVKAEVDAAAAAAPAEGTTLFGEFPLVDELVRKFGGEIVDEKDISPPDSE